MRVGHLWGDAALIPPFRRSASPEDLVTPSRLALVTDAWHPQTNGVVHTLSPLVRDLGAMGPRCSCSRRTPTARCPCRPIRRSGWPATPGGPSRACGVPPGRRAHRHRRAARPLDSRLARPQRPALHDQLPHALPGVPAARGSPSRWPGATGSSAGSTGGPSTRWWGRSRSSASSQARGVGRRLVHWPRGVDADAFHPAPPAGRRLPVPGPDLALRRAAWRSRRAWRTSCGCRCPAPRSWWATARPRGACSAATPTRLARLALRRGAGRALRERGLLRLPVAHGDVRQRPPGSAGLRPAGRLGARARARRSDRRRRQRRAGRDLLDACLPRAALLARGRAGLRRSATAGRPATHASAPTSCRSCGGRGHSSLQPEAAAY